MKEYAAKIGIHLLFIAPGLTDKIQVLNGFAFGAMKTDGRRMDRNHAAAFEQTNKQITAAS
jgi:hypothetical protein